MILLLLLLLQAIFIRDKYFNTLYIDINIRPVKKKTYPLCPSTIFLTAEKLLSLWLWIFQIFSLFLLKFC